jgi:hypothetical protein
MPYADGDGVACLADRRWRRSQNGRTTPPYDDTDGAGGNRSGGGLAPNQQRYRLQGDRGGYRGSTSGAGRFGILSRQWSLGNPIRPLPFELSSAGRVLACIWVDSTDTQAAFLP